MVFKSIQGLQYDIQEHPRALRALGRHPASGPTMNDMVLMPTPEATIVMSMTTLDLSTT